MTAEELAQHQAQQLARLKRRLGPTETEDKDELLQDLLRDTECFVRVYTGRKTLPLLLDGVMVELAAGSYNRLGLEGQSAHSEGGVSASFDALPPPLRAMLDMCRVGKVGSL